MKYLTVTVAFGDWYNDLITAKHRVPLDELTTYGVGSALTAKIQADVRGMVEQLLTPDERLVPSIYPLLSTPAVEDSVPADDVHD